MTRITSFAQSNAIALIALFIALGGTSYAAVAIPRNSVGTRQLRTGAVTPAKLAGASFGGHILDLAQITPIGKIVMSDPKGARTENWNPASGGILIWPHRIPDGCFPLTSASSALQFGGSGPPYVGAQLASSRGGNRIQVETSGQTSVTLAVVCGR
jgi:hypothetical protein